MNSEKLKLIYEISFKFSLLSLILFIVCSLGEVFLPGSLLSELFSYSFLLFFISYLIFFLLSFKLSSKFLGFKYSLIFFIPLTPFIYYQKVYESIR